MTCAYNVSSLQVYLTVSSELYHLARKLLLFLGVEECHCLFAASHETRRVRLELIALVRRHGRHLLHLYLRR